MNKMLSLLLSIFTAQSTFLLEAASEKKDQSLLDEIGKSADVLFNDIRLYHLGTGGKIEELVGAGEKTDETLKPFDKRYEIIKNHSLSLNALIAKAKKSCSCK